MQFFPSSYREWRFPVVLTALVVSLQACGGGGDATVDPAPLDSASFPPPVAQESTPAPVEFAQTPAQPAPAPAGTTSTPSEPIPAPNGPMPVPANLQPDPAEPILSGPTPAPSGLTPAPAEPAPDQTSSSLIFLSPTTSCSISSFRERFLQLINAARTSGRTCGTQAFAPATALAWNDMLFSAAARHSLDMATGDYYSHLSPDGTNLLQRVAAEGYTSWPLAENIGAGYGSLDAVMAGWLDSAGHCRNIMQPVFADVGLACVYQPGTRWGTYWTMDLGTP